MTPDLDGIFSGERRGVGADTQLLAGPFELWAEYLSTRFEPDSGFPQPRFDADGGYVQGSYFIVPDRFQAVLKYETFDPNTDRDDNETNTITAGANYFFKGHDLKIMLNYLHTELPGPAESQDKILARLQVVF